MARYQVATAAADPVRPSLEGVAKCLVDRLFGPEGPAWGTKLSAIEDTLKAVRQVLTEKMLDEALQRQANTVEQRPPAFQNCPKCGREVQRDPDSDDARIHQTDVGEAEWLEPATYCHQCRRSFFPSDQELGIDRTEWSPTLQRKLVRAGTQNTSFAKGSDDLRDYLDLQVDPKQIERVTKRIGQERCAQRDADVEHYRGLPLVERKDQPEGVTPPALAVVSVDGGRLQIRGTTAAANGTDEEVPLDAQQRGKHWREDKIGLLMTMTSTPQVNDPCPQVPAAFVDPTRIVQLTRELKTKQAARQEAAAETDPPETGEEVLDAAAPAARWEPPQVASKHLTATCRPWAAFGPMVATAAWTLGFFQAGRRAFVGDGSDHVWTVWRNHFSSFVGILDIIHAIRYVFAAATAGRAFADGWPCYVQWMEWVWQGKIEEVMAALAQRQAALGAVQEGDSETAPRRVVSTALGYLQNHKERMRYAEYRRQGLPITSSYVESAVKQFNTRVKGTEKFWTEAGAEALLQLRADYLSSDDVVGEFWQARQANATGQARYDLAV